MRILTQSDVKRLFPMSLALDAARTAASEYTGGHAMVPRRAELTMDDRSAHAFIMPGYLGRVPALGMKMVSEFANNQHSGLPSVFGTLLLLEPDTGRALALMDATYLTSVRTGAMSGVACDYLAREDASTLAVIGTGGQAESQLAAIIAARPIRHVRVWSRTADHVAAFVDEAVRNHSPVEIEAASSSEEAVRGADIVVTATTAKSPVVRDEWVSRGTFLCAVGSHAPDSAEIEPETVARAERVVVDTRAGAGRSGGDIAIPIAKGLLQESEVIELGELVLRTASGRQAPDEITVFKSVGFAAVDLVAAKMVLDAAIDAGVGEDVDLQ